MLFYKVTVKAPEMKIEEEKRHFRSDDDEMARLLSGKIREKLHTGEEYNQLHGDGCFCFVSSIRGNEITCGMIAENNLDADKAIRRYMRAFGLIVKNISYSEVLLSTMKHLLRRANPEYIEDDDEILEKYGIDSIEAPYTNYMKYGEKLLDKNTDSEQLYYATENYLALDTMKPELDRIYSAKSNSKAFGHPVHYMIETDIPETGKELEKALLQALYDNGRLRSRRVCTVVLRLGRFSSRFFDAVYKSCTGGAVVVHLYPSGGQNEDDDFADDINILAEEISEKMKKYRNSVLTVLCLPRVCDKMKKVIFENLGSIGVVEIREDLANREKSCNYLRFLAKKNSMRTDKKLFSSLHDDTMYLPDELRTIFDEWYNEKMKTSVFPQYKGVASCRKEAVKEAPRGNAYDELSEMIGLGEAKSVIRKALGYYKIQSVYKDKGISQDRVAMHMVFTGNPGTAKTTVARLFARIMKENGLLSKGHLVEVGRSDLVGKYVGWTAHIVKDKFKSASGGVLFIDEAYSLVEDRGGLYGDEAINTIVQEMENRRDDLVVIFAGYPNEMEAFLNKNPGLRSRIAFHVPFADYNTEELCGIARMIGKSKGVSFSNEAMEKLSVLFDDARLQEDFGNGRYVRNLIELSKMNQACRILEKNPDTLSDAELTRIEAVDIDAPLDKPKPKINSIGFAC